MIKTFEQFTANAANEPKIEYTPEEFRVVYDNITDYFGDGDIEEFIYSPDIEAKEEFIEENEIETLRVCQHCGKFMTEGYIYRDFETFCSKECFIAEHGKHAFDNADEDELYWTAWEG
jgi:hypothetical protein